MTSNSRYPFAVRLIGFAPEEAAVIDAYFAQKREQGYGYFRLPEDNLQDPDLFLANADDWKALVALSYLGPSDVRPVLLVGSPDVELPHARVPRPIRWRDFLTALDKLIEKRADALSGLAASDVVTVPERRRRDRLDLDLTDPSDYMRMRRSPVRGGVLIIDKNAVFSEYVAELLARRNVPVDWASNEPSAIDLCKRQKISVVMINTSTPEVDAYRLCKAIKTDAAESATVIFLIDKTFIYDQGEARRVGCDGFLNKPLNNHHLISALKKFLPQAS
jgi:CheY-like chemotaxis protein